MKANGRHRPAPTIVVHVGLVLSVATLGACSSKAVDVGGAGPFVYPRSSIYSTAKDVPPNGDSRPWKLADRFVDITGFAVDSGSVFFTGGPCDSATSLAPALLVECSAEDCAGTRRSRALTNGGGWGGSQRTYVAVNETQIFWTDFPPLSSISTQQRVDWSGPAPLGFGESTYGFAVDATQGFFSERSALLGCTLSDCASTVMRYAMRPPSGEDAFAGTGGIVVDDRFIYLTDGARILRVAKEGSDTFEVLARDLQGVGQLAVHEESIYWTESVVLGRVYSCPKTGCDGQPRILVGGLDTPNVLAADDQYVYFVEGPVHETRNEMTPEGSSVISRCPVTGCETPETLVGGDEGVTGPLVVDDNFLYFLGQRCSRGEHLPGLPDEPCSYLAAMRK